MKIPRGHVVVRVLWINGLKWRGEGEGERGDRENEESDLAKSPKKSERELQIERAYFLVNQALQEDEQGHDQEAIELYTQAVQVCLEAVRKLENNDVA